MVKKLLIEIKIPMPDIPNGVAEKIATKMLMTGVKKMFPTDKLPPDSTVEFSIIEDE